LIARGWGGRPDAEGLDCSHSRTTRLDRLQEGRAAASLTLRREETVAIEGAAASITAQGARYPEDAQRMIDR